MPKRDWTGPKGQWPRTWARMWKCGWSKNIPFNEGKWNQWCWEHKWEWNRRSAEQKWQKQK